MPHPYPPRASRGEGDYRVPLVLVRRAWRRRNHLKRYVVVPLSLGSEADQGEGAGGAFLDEGPDAPASDARGRCTET
jgi:hypothetical protein